MITSLTFIKINMNENYHRKYVQPLSFYGMPLKEGRHRIHPYPAMLHPLLVDYLLESFANKDDIILIRLMVAALLCYKRH